MQDSNILSSHRPFFSIIVPCYNPRKYLSELLDSIVQQYLSNDIEVILADDHSTQDYQDIVDEYKEQLNIKQILTDYNFAPGNTREKGVSIATGEWITFVDQDDLLIEKTLFEVKQSIIDNNQKYHVVTGFIQERPDGEIIKQYPNTRNWCHGKFYNLDNFWKKYDIHFKKDMETHEDIYASVQVYYYLQLLTGSQFLVLDLYTYKWRAFPESLSRSLYADGRNFVEKFYQDYIDSTGYKVLQMYKNVEYQPEFEGWDGRSMYVQLSLIDILLIAYFYLQSFKFDRPDYIKQNEQILFNFYLKFMEVMPIDNKTILGAVGQNSAEWYNYDRGLAEVGAGKFIEQESFPQFLNKMAKRREEQSE